MRLLDEEVQGSIMKWHSTSQFKPVQAHNGPDRLELIIFDIIE